MMRVFALLSVFFLLTLPSDAQAQEGFVRYAAAIGEYSILLPEAPTVTSVWANSTLPSVYEIEPPAELASIGETGIFRRIDSDTGDGMSVKITTLQASATSLESLTEEQITGILEQQVSGLSLEKQQTSFSGGSKTLKWGTLTGYEIGNDQRLLFHAVHYLSGLQSVTLIHISFSLENRRFKNDYETIGRSIKFTGR